MRIKLHIYITLTLLLFSAVSFSQVELFNQKSQFLLNSFVQNGLVNYKNLYKDKKTISTLKESLKKVNPSDLSSQELKAFLINAYNITVIISITENMSKSSVMNIEGFFDKNKHQIAGKTMTLNDLEKNWIFKKFPDSRLHFALVCGALSCPELNNIIFNSQDVEHRLEKITKATLNNPKFITIDMHEKSASVSKLFDWYQTDFSKNESVIDFINKYTDKKIPDGFSLEFKKYNWNLNQG